MSDPPPDPTDPTGWIKPPGTSAPNVGAAIRRHLRENNPDWLNDAAVAAIANRIAAETGDPPHEAEVEAVASFFPHFRRDPPPLVEFRVCCDLPCWLRGAAEITRQLREDEAFVKLKPERLQITEVSCLGRCDRAPAACASRFARAAPDPSAGWPEVRDHLYLGRSPDDLRNTVRALLGGEVPPSDTDRTNPRLGGPRWELTRVGDDEPPPDYAFARTVLTELCARPRPDRAAARRAFGEQFITDLKSADLRGMGGPGEPAARKWDGVLKAPATDTKYVVANADESEPGTFKDRDLLLVAPALVVEGVVLAGLAVGAGRGYVYIRHEYGEQIRAVRQAIADAERAGVCGYNVQNSGFDFPVSVFVSPGGYICGEQTALIEAMEGKRAQPRNRPPELGANGLFNQPTLLTNVETLAWAAAVARNGYQWYHNPAEGRAGWRFFSVSGDVNRPGVYEFPIGGTLGELIDRAEGVVGGVTELVAVGPSGPSGGFLPPDFRGGSVLDLRLDTEVFRRLGVPLGAGVIVYATRSFAGRTVLDAALNASEFFMRESCGKCVPCRLGTQKLVELGVRRRAGDPTVVPGLFTELAAVMAGASICGLGHVAPNPLVTALTHTFPA